MELVDRSSMMDRIRETIYFFQFRCEVMKNWANGDAYKMKFSEHSFSENFFFSRRNSGQIKLNVLKQTFVSMLTTISIYFLSWIFQDVPLFSFR